MALEKAKQQATKIWEMSLSVGDNEHAMDYFKKSLAIRQESGDRKGESLSYGNLGNV